MTVRALGPTLGIVWLGCGGAPPPPARSCDQLGNQNDLREQCRLRGWTPEQIACVDQNGDGCLTGSGPPKVDEPEECRPIRVALNALPSRFAEHVGAAYEDEDESDGATYLQSTIRFPGMECVIEDHYASEETSLLCQRRYDDVDAAAAEYRRLREALGACMDETWQTKEVTAEGVLATRWSSDLDTFHVPQVMLAWHPTDDAGVSVLQVMVDNTVERR